MAKFLEMVEIGGRAGQVIEAIDRAGERTPWGITALSSLGLMEGEFMAEVAVLQAIERAAISPHVRIPLLTGVLFAANGVKILTGLVGAEAFLARRRFGRGAGDERE